MSEAKKVSSARDDGSGESSPRNYDERHQSVASNQAAGVAPPTTRTRATTLRGTDQGLSSFASRPRDTEDQASVMSGKAARLVPPTTNYIPSRLQEEGLDLKPSAVPHSLQQDDLNKATDIAAVDNFHKVVSNHDDDSVDEKNTHRGLAMASRTPVYQPPREAAAAHDDNSVDNKNNQRGLALASRTPAYQPRGATAAHDENLIDRDVETAIGGVDPPPTTLRRTTQASVRPGAFREGGGPQDDEETLFTAPEQSSALDHADVGTVTAEAVTRDSLVNEIREELQAQIHGNTVAAEVVLPSEPNPPYWTRKRLRIASALLVIVIIAVVVGVVFATRNSGNKNSGNDNPSPAPTTLPTPAPMTAAPTSWQQVGQSLLGRTAGDNSGFSISLNQAGTILAVGSPNAQGSPGDGRVDIWSFSPSIETWFPFGDPIGVGVFDNFGRSVSLSDSGTRLAVGANDCTRSGPGYVHVYEFEFNTRSWSRIGQVLVGSAACDRFGWSVALSGDGSTLVVGAIGADNGGDSNSGSVQVFRLQGDSWVAQGQVVRGAGFGDQLGISVSVSTDGSLFAVGANQDFDGPGYVRVYQWDGAGWVQMGGDIVGANSEDEQGFSVSLSANGTVVGIGAIGADNTGDASGRTVILQWGGSTWEQVGNTIVGEASGDESGYAVALSDDGSVICIGARFNGGNGRLSGHLRVFENSGLMGNWTLIGSDIDGEAQGDEFGFSASLSGDGNVVAGGAIGNDPDVFSGGFARAGHTRVFRWNE